MTADRRKDILEAIKRETGARPTAPMAAAAWRLDSQRPQLTPGEIAKAVTADTAPPWPDDTETGADSEND